MAGLAPMLATPGPMPTGPGWGFEFKWDGVRAIVEVDRGSLRILSRNNRDVTASYPELCSLTGALRAARLVLDGEIVALTASGVPSFSRLQQRIHQRSPSPALRAAVPVRLYAFDLLAEDGRLLVGRPYTQRRTRLEALDLPEPVPPWWQGNGADVMAAAVELGLEGVVAKRLTSPYEPGRRSPSWVKTPLNRTVEVAVGGWKPGSGGRAGQVGSLLLGLPDAQGCLRYVGHVGTGFTRAMLRDLGQRLGRLARLTPALEGVPREHARTAHWVEPSLVGEVMFRTWTPDGRLRHPAWRGLRPDRSIDELVRLDGGSTPA
ncbi:non-homologous end-joining DNA ligase [Rhizomonospora bruguierae]|uniref:non-homologous end-joining DNA ligase n=1 Tax=Rhizomonospora bruguierae TaxID=1581705 RepID=UPI0020BD4F35|nr:non-homologous end-joining DNA ligase [Micromonospora sp. NBRC 107566]